MPKIIVLTGHGTWSLGEQGYAKLPAKSSMNFYTMNAKTLSDSLGGDIDRGIVAGLEPDQQAGPFEMVPNMSLLAPVDPVLNIRAPDPATWNTLYVDEAVPVDNRNLQVRLRDDDEEYASLSYLFDYLAPAIRNVDSVVFLWAACRHVKLKKTERGKKIGVNSMQR